MAQQAEAASHNKVKVHFLVIAAWPGDIPRQAFFMKKGSSIAEAPFLNDIAARLTLLIAELFFSVFKVFTNELCIVAQLFFDAK